MHLTHGAWSDATSPGRYHRQSLLSETATGLAAKADTSEYGVPTVTAPAKYSWLGASELPTELPSGVTAMGARSYVPQVGRFLQPDPVPGGSANAYSYTFGDPVDTSDPTGDYAATISTGFEAGLENELQQLARERKKRDAEAEAAFAAKIAAEAAEAAAAAAAAAGPQYVGGEEEWEEFGEEGEYEYAVYQHGQDEAHVEPAVLVQPLNGKVGRGEEAGTLGSAVPLCKAGSEGPCASPARGGEGTCKSCRRRRHYTKAQIAQFEHEKCQTVGVGIAIAGFFVPEARLAKAIAAGIGVGAALAC